MKEEVKNMAEFEKKKKTCTNIGLGEQLFLLNFWTPLICKDWPNFCQLGIHPFKKTVKFSFKSGQF